MTKREVRVQLLADLKLPPDGVLWDLGVRVGSIGLEALRLARTLGLWAVERRGGSAALINRPCPRLGCIRPVVLEGEALEPWLEPGFDDTPLPCPTPDRVLIGGWRSAAGPVLQAVLERLRPAGVVGGATGRGGALGRTGAPCWSGPVCGAGEQHQGLARGIPGPMGTRLFAAHPGLLVLRGRRSSGSAPGLPGLSPAGPPSTPSVRDNAVGGPGEDNWAGQAGAGRCPPPRWR